MTFKDRSAGVASAVGRFMRAQAWRLAVLALLAWIGSELHEINRSMPDYTWELRELSKEVQNIREKLDEIYRDRIFR